MENQILFFNFDFFIIPMNLTLLPIFYLPPISWFKKFLSQENEILFEKMENFPKQTYRNRANIYGANGKLALIIPTQHNPNRLYKDTEITYQENWQKLHWKSIKIAYQSSAYFEYYESEFSELYQEQPKFLMDFNLKGLEIIQKILKTQVGFDFTNEFSKDFDGKNFRDHFSPKKETEMEAKKYFQVFEDKYDFIKDLSIIDLLFNMGPEYRNYL